MIVCTMLFSLYFFFNDTATTEIYTLSLHDALPIFPGLEGLSVALLVATVVVLPAGLASLPRWTGEHVLKGIGLAVLSSLLPYSLELIALRRMPPRIFGILLSLEPAAAALAGLLVLGQRLEPLQMLGLVLVVGASVVVMSAGRAPASVEEMSPGT